MSDVHKAFRFGLLGTAAIAGVVCLIVYGIGLKPELAAVVIILGAAGSGLLAGPVERRMPPPKQRR
jgi:hypothetical protein